MIYSLALKTKKRSVLLNYENYYMYKPIFLGPALRPSTRNGVNYDIQVLRETLSDIPSYPIYVPLTAAQN